MKITLTLKKIFSDKPFFASAIFALIFSVLISYLFYNFIVVRSVFWATPMFLPIYIYIIVIYFINIVVALAVHQKTKFLALCLNGITISVSFLLLAAYIINLNNPNG